MPGGSKIKHILFFFKFWTQIRYLYMSHQYMAIDRGRFRRRRGVHAPSPKNPFLGFFLLKSVTRLPPNFISWICPW